MKKELIAYRNPKSPTSEMFRNLRTNIQFMASNKQIKTILITSTLPAEGKSWVASNLAVTFAQAGKEVILVDSDMRKGRIHTIFGVERKPGISNYLSGIDETGNFTDYNISAYLKRTEIENLLVLPAGNIPPNPSELLITDRAKEMINELESKADIVIFDGTPSLLVTDAIILSRYVDSTIIVTAYKETKIENLQKVKKNIRNVGGKIAGVVLNKIPTSARKNYYYYYGNDAEALVAVKNQKNVNRAVSKKERVAREIEMEAAHNKARLENMIKQNTERTKQREHINKNQIIANNERKPRTIEATIDTTNNILQQLNKYLEQEKANIRRDESN